MTPSRSLTVVPTTDAPAAHRSLFSTDKLTREYAVVIIHTGRTIFTSPEMDLAKGYLRRAADRYGDLEVREIVTRIESRRAYRPRKAVEPRQQAQMAGAAA